MAVFPASRPKMVAGLEPWFVHSGLLWKHGGATWRTFWMVTCSLCPNKKLILRWQKQKTKDLDYYYIPFLPLNSCESQWTFTGINMYIKGIQLIKKKNYNKDTRVVNIWVTPSIAKFQFECQSQNLDFTCWVCMNCYEMQKIGAEPMCNPVNNSYKSSEFFSVSPGQLGQYDSHLTVLVVCQWIQYYCPWERWCG